MYIIANKATFTNTDAIKANIKNNIKFINTTSLSDSKNYLVKWQHTPLISFPMSSTIYYLLQKIKRTQKYFIKSVKYY